MFFFLSFTEKFYKQKTNKITSSCILKNNINFSIFVTHAPNMSGKKVA